MPWLVHSINSIYIWCKSVHILEPKVASLKCLRAKSSRQQVWLFRNFWSLLYAMSTRKNQVSALNLVIYSLSMVMCS